MNTWADIRDLAERVLDDGGCSSNYIGEAADLACALMVAEPHDDRGKVAYAIVSMLDAEPYGMCDWERIARGARVLADSHLSLSLHVWDKSYDPKAEGARKLNEGWCK